MKNESGYRRKLGMFVTIGLLLFVATIYFVGKQKNLFGATLSLHAKFRSVSGLKEGNNVRFSGINIGTVDGIELLTDTSVMVDMVIRKEVQQFIKTNALASIGSDGLMGDKVLTISAGPGQGTTVTEGNVIASKKAIEMEDLMAGVKTSVDNAAVITAELAKFSYSMNNGNGALSRMISDQEFGNSLKATLSNLRNSSDEFAKFTYSMNNGKGALSKLMTDEKFGNTLDSTMSNLQASTKKLDQNMEAAQHNILLRGFFKKQEKAKAKKIADEKKAADLKLKNDLKKAKSSGVIQGADTLLIK